MSQNGQSDNSSNNYKKAEQIQIITGYTTDKSTIPAIDFQNKVSETSSVNKKIIPLKDQLNKTINKTFLQMSIMQSNITKSSVDHDNTPKN